MPKRPHRDIIEDLGNEGRVGDAVLLAWSVVEMNLDSALLYAYKIPGPDPRSDPLVEMRIGDKIRVQKKLGNLTEEEANTIQKFKAARDDLFHRGGLVFPNFQEEEKKRLMKLATGAADVSYELVRRASASRDPAGALHGRQT
jgi:hypothetical protein